MGNFLRIFCGCCYSASDDDDDTHLVTDDDNYTNATSGYHSQYDNRSAPSVDPVLRANMTPQEEEAAILHRILLDTQAAVIDVNNMESNGGQGGTIIAGNRAFTDRMQKYDQAMKRADTNKLRRHIDAVSNNGVRSGMPQGGSNSANYGSMDDVGNAASDILNAPQIGSQLSDFAVDRQRAMREAMTATMRVQHQEDLVVHMN